VAGRSRTPTNDRPAREACDPACAAHQPLTSALACRTREERLRGKQTITALGFGVTIVGPNKSCRLLRNCPGGA
jgi:hypothetical protein